MLAGEAGVGKTRLAREVLVKAQETGSATHWVACSESARAVPLGALSSLVGNAVDDPVRVIGGVADRMAVEGADDGVMVVVDDAHLLDPLSALLVQQLVLRRAATLIVTVRNGELAPDAITALWKDDQLERFEVQPLDEDETGALLAAVLGGPVDSSSLRRMWDMAGGNILFLRQLVDEERRADRLRDMGGVWRWIGGPIVSPRLADLIVARIGLLPVRVGEVIDLLALGEPLSVSLLARLSDPMAVEDAETHGLLRIERVEGRLQARLAHPLFGEVRRNGLGRLRARRLRGQIAQGLADHPDDELLDSLRRAVLLLDSDLEHDPALLCAAARSAASLVDLELTERLARAAVAAGGGFEPRLTLARTLSFQNRADEAEAELAALGEVASDDLERVLVTLTRAANLLWTARRPLDAGVVVNQAEATIIDAGCVGVLVGLRATLLACEGRPTLAEPLATETLKRSTLPALAVMCTTFALVNSLGVMGRATELDAAARRGYEQADRSADSAFLRFGLSYLHVGGLRLAGLVHEAEVVADSCRRASADMASPAQQYGIVVAAQATMAAGRVRAALRSLRESRAALVPVDNNGFGFVGLLLLTEALAVSGDATSARERCDELEADRHPAFAYLEPEVLLACAWVAAAEGGVRRSRTLALEAADEAVRLGQPAQEVLALQTAARFGDRSVAERLARLVGAVQGPRVSAAAAHAAALAADDGVGLVNASQQLEEMGDMLAAADAAAHAVVAFELSGRSSSAAAASARAQRLTEECEGAVTPALVAVARPLPLTAREREIVSLAAQNLSNREIAVRLYVSVRTVEGHLYNASVKLGTNSRLELAAVLAGH